MPTQATDEIKKYLEPNEVLVWAGQPKKGVYFEAFDFFKLLYAIIFFIFIWYVTKLLFENALIILLPICIIFFIVSIFFGIGTIFFDAHLRKKIFYGLTDKRIIITSSIKEKKLQSIYFSAKPKIEFLPNFGETSTIDVGLKEPSGYGTGRITWMPNVKGYTYLYRIEDGAAVHQKIKQIINSDTAIVKN